MTLTGLEQSTETSEKRANPERGAAKSGALSPDSGPAAPAAGADSLPPDLADLPRRLAALPEALRANILAMVKAAGETAAK